MRTHSVFDKTRIKLAQAVSTYRAAREAITKLALDEQLGPWKKLLLELNDGDVQGPGPKDSDTSTSHFTQSWVWTTALQTSTSAEDNDINQSLRVEWCKGQEQAKRYEEEVELVVEEMCRTLATFELNTSDLDKRAGSLLLSGSAVEAAVVNGAAAYAFKQASIQRRLVKVFMNNWYTILEGQPLSAHWLSKYTRLLEKRRNRLVCNVQRYHAILPDVDGIGGALSGVDLMSPGSNID